MFGFLGFGKEPKDSPKAQTKESPKTQIQNRLGQLKSSKADNPKSNSTEELPESPASPSKNRRIEIGTPFDVRHNIHVNLDFQWDGIDPDKEFILQEKLGEGSFGAVWKALHEATNLTLAIKILETETNAVGLDDDIKREIEILKKCNHPNIVKYFGCVRYASQLWILMDYCAMGSVEDLMIANNKTLSENQIVYIIAATLKGLDYLHTAKKIIHRDVKAANILVTEKGEIKLADFGVSHQLATSLFQHSESAIVGTPLYLSPEAIRNKVYSPKMDVWALGITIIELADGYPPHVEMNPIRAMYSIPHRPPPTVATPSDWPSEFLRFLTRCLKKDPNERPQARELLADPYIFQAKGPEVLKEFIDHAIKNKAKKSKAGNITKKLKTHFQTITKKKSRTLDPGAFFHINKKSKKGTLASNSTPSESSIESLLTSDDNIGGTSVINEDVEVSGTSIIKENGYTHNSDYELSGTSIIKDEESQAQETDGEFKVMLDKQPSKKTFLDKSTQTDPVEIRPIAKPHEDESGFRSVHPPVSPRVPKAKLDLPSPKWRDGVVPKAPSPLPYGQPAVKESLVLPEVTVTSAEVSSSPNKKGEAQPRQPSPGILLGGGFEFKKAELHPVNKPVSKTPSNEKSKGKNPENTPVKIRNRRSSSFSEGQMEIIEAHKLAFLEAEKLVARKEKEKAEKAAAATRVSSDAPLGELPSPPVANGLVNSASPRRRKLVKTRELSNLKFQQAKKEAEEKAAKAEPIAEVVKLVSAEPPPVTSRPRSNTTSSGSIKNISRPSSKASSTSKSSSKSATPTMGTPTTGSPMRPSSSEGKPEKPPSQEKISLTNSAGSATKGARKPAEPKSKIALPPKKTMSKYSSLPVKRSVNHPKASEVIKPPEDREKKPEDLSDSKKVEPSISEPIVIPVKIPESPDYKLPIPKESLASAVPKPPAKSLIIRPPVSRPHVKSVLKPPSSKQAVPPVKSVQQSHSLEPQIGQNVTLAGGRKGVVRFVGALGDDAKIWVGVELDTPDGKHNGVFKGKQYFTCGENRGVFVAPEKIVVV